MQRHFTITALPMLLLAAGLSAAPADEISLHTSAGGIRVTRDGQPWAEYLTHSGTKPIVWPIFGPGGQAMTRAFPMDASQQVTTDHPHHRSLWFSHGDVNGIDFWTESPGAGKPAPGILGRGTIVHRRFATMLSGAEAVLVSENDWLGPDGKKVCADRRRVTFAADGDSRRIDFTITLLADSGPVTFGDTKEGSFGLRVADGLRVDARRGARIINSQGLSDEHAWGQRAAWVDYSGPLDGHDVGIAIFNHPQSFRYPTRWHVRTYGLFAANPFGEAAFQGKHGSGSYRLAAGKSITLGYRVLLYQGQLPRGKVAGAFAAYAKTVLKTD